MEQEKKYKVTEEYPSAAKGEYYMCDCGGDFKIGKKYYIVSTEAKPDAKDFSHLVTGLLNNHTKEEDRIREIMDMANSAIMALEAYTELLGEELSELVNLVHNRGWKSHRHAKGSQLRLQVQESLKNYKEKTKIGQ